jgi:phage repressor protein C with HTH and peptisase S24 domain
MKLSDRLKKVRESSGRTQKDLAVELGLSVTAIQGYESGRQVPGGNVLESLAKMGININWLLIGEGEMSRRDSLAVTETEQWPPEGYIHIPHYEIAASAGGGALVNSEQVVDYMTFKADYVRTSLGLSPADAAVISVIGDSMEPYLADGDLILIDQKVTRIEDDSVYVIQSGDSLKVKRIQKMLDGTVIVKSDNNKYEAEVYRGETVEYLRVVGRLVRRLVR